MIPPIKNVSNRLRHYTEFAAYERTRRRLANGPRFTPGRVSILGWELDFVDGPALTSCVDTVVIKGWNDFTSDNDRPYIIDCGANIGVTVLNYKRHFPNARIIAIEPDPNIIPVLRRNLLQNGATDVEILEAAVWTHDGEMPLLCQGADGSKIISGDDAAPSLSTSIVKTVDLNRFLSEKVDLIKMDIEGAEYEVVPHIANKLLSVKNMLIECHINNGEVGKFSRLLNALCSVPFKVSVNTYGAWRDLVRRPAKLPDEFDQYALIAAWRS